MPRGIRKWNVGAFRPADYNRATNSSRWKVSSLGRSEYSLKNSSSCDKTSRRQSSKPISCALNRFSGGKFSMPRRSKSRGPGTHPKGVSTASARQPMLEIMAHVVAAKREHGHGVAPDFSDLAGGGGSGFRTHGGADIDAVDPVERLKNQGDGRGAAAAKDNPADGNSLRVVGLRRKGGVVGGGRAETAVGMGGRFRPAGGPGIAFPIGQIGRGLFCLAFPPDIQIGGQSDVGVNGVPLN